MVVVVVVVAVVTRSAGLVSGGMDGPADDARQRVASRMTRSAAALFPSPSASASASAAASSNSSGSSI